MNYDDTLLRLIGSVYRAPLDPDHWTTFLGEYADAVGGVGAAMHWIDKGTNEHVDGALSGVDTASMGEYSAYYWMHDPRMSWALTRSGGTLFVDYDLITEPEMARSEFYEDFLRRYGLRYFIGTIAINDERAHCGIAIHRSPKQVHFDAREIALAKHLTPHIRRAAQLQSRLRQAKARQDSLAAALDRVPFGVIFVDARGSPVFMNSIADAIVCEADGLRSTPSGLAAALTQETVRLRRAIAGASATGAGLGVGAGIAMALSRPTERRPLEVLVSPLPHELERIGAISVAAIVFVHDPELEMQSVRAVLADLYGLTPAQAALAEAIVLGKTLDQFAAETGRRAATLRKMLKVVFDKTSTKRQAELVQCLLRGPSALGGSCKYTSPSD